MALLLLAAGILVASAWHGGVREALPALAPAAAAVAIGWFAFLGPRLEIRPDGIELVGAVRRTHVPWAAFVDADAKWGLRIDVAGGRPVRWSALGRVDRREGGYSEGASRYFLSAFSRHRAAEEAIRRAGAVRGSAHPTGDDLAFGRWTDPASTAAETVRLSSAQTAMVLVEYADAVGGGGRAEAGSGTQPGAVAQDAARVRRSVRIVPLLAIAVPVVATALLYS